VPDTNEPLTYSLAPFRVTVNCTGLNVPVSANSSTFEANGLCRAPGDEPEILPPIPASSAPK
jgi:hypothetical protein